MNRPEHPGGEMAADDKERLSIAASIDTTERLPGWRNWQTQGT